MILKMEFEEKRISEEKNSGKSTKVDLPVLSFATQEEFVSWQMHNHTDMNGIWVRFYKKNSGIKTIVYDEALDVALCYGWIDGQLKKYDETSYIQRFTPRRAKSIWSKRNVGKVENLIQDGKMKPSGLKEFEAAKADGRYESSYDSQGNMIIPTDFLTEIEKNKKAHEFFKTLNKTNLYAIGWRLQTATNPQIRIKRINELIEKLEKEQKFH